MNFLMTVLVMTACKVVGYGIVFACIYYVYNAASQSDWLWPFRRQK